MGLSPQLITDRLYQKIKIELDSMSKDNRKAIRLRAMASAKEHGVALTAKIFGVTGNTIRLWVKEFARGGAEELEYKKGRGRKSALSDRHYDAILRWTEEDCNITIKQLVLRLAEIFGVKTSKSAVHRVLHQLRLSYITPRPVHHKQDESTHERFKKKSARGDS